jgi:hypothetical protein
MKRLLIAILLPCFFPAQAASDCWRSDLVARSRALGGAFASRADDASAVFVNPAGLATVDFSALYVDYEEPAGVAEGRESRAALIAPAGGTHLALGWYRFADGGEAAENILVAGAARKVIEGTPGSYLAVGVNGRVGLASAAGACCGERESSWSNPTADVGLIVRPLPVISLAYAIGNVSNEPLGVGRLLDRSGRLQRWGISYFWEERVVVSFEERFCGGSKTFHYGASVRSALPVELMAGFSNGNAAGGLRWVGGLVRAVIAFSSDGAHGVTWTAACEIAYAGREKREY